MRLGECLRVVDCTRGYWRGTGPASAQKSGGILKISFFDSPASMSLHEEATGAALRPMMGVFNNLVMYDQQIAQNGPHTIRPRPRRELDVERGRQGADLPTAPGRQMA